jgi:cytochrome c553
VATPASAPDSPFTHGKPADGATKAAVCAACHGPNGNSTNPDWPRLAGQSAVYIAGQLRLFRSGARPNPVMIPMATSLSDQDIADLAVYYEAQTPVGLEADPSYWQAGQSAVYIAGQLRLFRSGARPNPVMMPMATSLSDQDIADLAVYYEAQTPVGLEADPSYWQAGEGLYLRGARDLPACTACHGPEGRGNLAAGYPALRAQQSVYVMKQLNDYASGARYSGATVPPTDPNAVMMFTIAKQLTPEQIRDVASYVQGMR